MNPSELYCTYPNNPSTPAKMSTLKDKVLKFYVICRNHKLPFIGMLGRDPRNLCFLGAPPQLSSLAVLLLTPSSNSLGPCLAR